MKEVFDLIRKRMREELTLYEKAIKIVSEVEAEYGKKGCALCYLGNPCEYQNEDVRIPDELMGWIPCSERLPENDDDVLVWYRYRMMQGVNIVGSKEMHGIGHYYEPTGSWLVYGGLGLDQNVIAWMPLPSPFKTEKGE